MYTFTSLVGMLGGKMKRTATSSLVLRVVLAAAAICLGASFVMAQVDTGSIIGTVRDTSGAVVSGAKVTLTNEGTGAALSTTTTPDGVYKFSPVRIGSYKLEATAPGFQTVSQTKVVVNVSANVLVDFALKPGSTSETIEVTAAPPTRSEEHTSELQSR